MSSYSKDRIHSLFSVVPKTYEKINHMLTFGLDMYWRNRAATMACRISAARILDCCSGTGEFAAAIHRRMPKCRLLVAGDFSREMLKYSKTRIRFVKMTRILMEAETLPFSESSMDLVTISFGVRNINRSNDIFQMCISECYRVLTPGGRLILVETSQPPNRIIRRLYHLYVRVAVEKIGSILSKTKSPYRYLSRTIPSFYTPNELSSILRSVGFKEIRIYPLTLGIVCVHEAFK